MGNPAVAGPLAVVREFEEFEAHEPRTYLADSQSRALEPQRLCSSYQ